MTSLETRMNRSIQSKGSISGGSINPFRRDAADVYCRIPECGRIPFAIRDPTAGVSTRRGEKQLTQLLQH